MNKWSLSKSNKTVPIELFKLIRLNFTKYKNLNSESNICTFHGVKFTT